MSRAELIYPLKENVERELSRVRSDPHNSEVLMRYYKVRSPLLALATTRNILSRLNNLSKVLGKRFEDADLQDIEDLVFKINKRCRHPNTAARYCKLLKRFYQWLRGCDDDEYPPEVKWIKVKKPPLCTITKDDLISYDECIRITEHASNLRDKALFQCKLDAGCRIGEILTVTVGEVEINDMGAVLQSDGKTGKAPLILTWSAKTLVQWLNMHPFRNDPQAPLWPLLERERPSQMSYAAAYHAFKKCVKKAKIPKRVWPHLFKHVSSSYDSEIGLPDSYRKFKHHWTPNSRMAEVYEHLSSSVIPKIQLQTMRLMNQDVDESKVRTQPQKVELHKKCRRCDFDNMRDATYCNRCAFPLNDSEAMEMSLKRSGLETLLKKVRDDPEKLEKLLSIIG